PFDLSAFLVPSTDNFAQFVMSWDKMLSDNIDKKFFEGVIEPVVEEERKDGRITITEKGTLRLLAEWLDRKLTGTDKAAIIDHILKPLQAIRRQRQEPAHRFQQNKFSKDFHEQRCRTLVSIFDALTTLRAVLSRFPKARHIEAPAWLRDGKIDVF